jgi:hypothetical protein
MEPLVHKIGHHIRQRRNPGCNGRRPDNKKIKREEAIERQAYFAGLSTEQKIALLDSRLGVGIGAKKQRAKLAMQLSPKKEEASQ